VASIFHQNNLKSFSENPLRIWPDDEHEGLLHDAVNDIKDAFVSTPPEHDFNILDGTRVLEEYRLNFGQSRAERPEFSITFVDTPGEFTRGLADDLKKNFETTRCAILTIDAVELLHGERIPYKVRRNDGEKARTLTQIWLDHAKKRREGLLLCIVPVKTETWLRTRTGYDTAAGDAQLFEKISEEYRGVLQELELHKDTIAVVYCPVQTAGNLEFQRYEYGGVGYPKQIFRKIVGDDSNGQAATGYSPLDCDQPLRHILNYVMIEEMAIRRELTKSESTGFIEELLRNTDELLNTDLQTAFGTVRHWLIDLFGQDSHKAKAVAHLLKGVKKDPPFRILQGAPLVQRQSLIWD
jgi:hypothetical protein